MADRDPTVAIFEAIRGYILSKNPFIRRPILTKRVVSIDTVNHTLALQGDSELVPDGYPYPYLGEYAPTAGDEAVIINPPSGRFVLGALAPQGVSSGGGGGGSGTVTSVSMAGDGTVFNVSVTGSPITGSGTLAPTLHTQLANTVLAGPTSGAAAVPTFRGVILGDLTQSGATTGQVPEWSGSAWVPATVSGGGGGGGANVSCASYNTGGESITTGAWFKIPFDTNDYNTGITRTLPSQPTKFIAANTGPHYLSADIWTSGQMDPTEDDQQDCAIFINGVLKRVTVNSFANNDIGRQSFDTTLHIDAALDLTAGDVVEFAVFFSAAWSFAGVSLLPQGFGSEDPEWTVYAQVIQLGGGGGGGSGTVTSVAMTGDGTVFNASVSGSAITGSGTLAPSLKSQSAHTVLAGPVSGGSAPPTFRQSVLADIAQSGATTGQVPEWSGSAWVPTTPSGGGGGGGTHLYPKTRPYTTVPPATQSKPGYLVPALDLTTGMKLTRISDKVAMAALLNADPNINDRTTQNYASRCAWNLDETWILLGFNEPDGVVLLDATGHGVQTRLTNTGSTLVWSYQQNDLVWQTWNGGAQLQSMTVPDCTRTIVHDFQASDNLTNLSIGGWGGQSDGQDDAGTVIAMLGQDRTTWQWYAIIWTVASSTYYKIALAGDLSDWNGNQAGNNPKNIRPSHSGTYFDVEWFVRGVGSQQGTRLYLTSTGASLGMLSPAINHPDWGWDTLGNEVFSIQNQAIADSAAQGGHVAGTNGVFWDTMPGGIDSSIATYRADMTNYSSGFASGFPWFAAAPLTAGGVSFSTLGMHLSGRNLHRPHYVYSSMTGRDAGKMFDNAIFACLLDPTINPTTNNPELYGTSQHYGSQYYNQPKATVNRAGDKIIFSSDWTTGDGTEVNSYLLEAP